MLHERTGKPPSQARAVVCIGAAQVLAWGSSYYLVSVLAAPMAAATGWSLAWIVAGPSLGFLVSGLVSPRVGRLIERHGGRPVLSASALVFAAGLVMLALAPAVAAWLAGWAVLGLAMGAGLYDPAFATLGQTYGDRARVAITQVTLIAGFASTICWPLSAFMVAHAGWRGACAGYAVLHLLVTLPLYRLGTACAAPIAAPQQAAPEAAPGARGQRFAFAVLASTFTLAAVIMTVISVHLLTILQERGVALETAVALGALVGPAQVGARLIDMLAGKRLHPLHSLLASTLLVAAGLFVLLAGTGGIGAAGLALYGAGSGIRSIARGTVPLVLFGRAGYAALLGRLALPTMIAQAASPFAGAVLLDRLGADATLRVLCGFAVVNVLVLLPLLPRARAPS
jgi:hypothetical protein